VDKAAWKTWPKTLKNARNPF